MRLILILLMTYTLPLQAQEALFTYSDEARCHTQDLPVLPLLIASQHDNQELLQAAVTEALQRGCDINEARPDDGLNALNAAILFAESEWVSFLLAQGADPSLKIHAPERRFHGMNSAEFARLLFELTQKNIYRDIEGLLP